MALAIDHIRTTTAVARRIAAGCRCDAMRQPRNSRWWPGRHAPKIGAEFCFVLRVPSYDSSVSRYVMARSVSRRSLATKCAWVFLSDQRDQ